ncbi:MAG: HAD family hydrolase [Treponema sp.]|jgi:phosphoglycolate phosphatase/putative hydrolase of the HAD superfamily|nr:HAD family hydrolase [Treponema sp.]
MKTFNVPANRQKLFLLFDMDGTLYSHEEYLQSQTDLPIKRLAMLKGKSFEQMSAEISEYRKNWSASNNGKALSLANAFTAFGITIEENIKWRNELCQPEKFLKPDLRLRSALEKLSVSHTLLLVTNNPVSVAHRTLLCLEVQDIFKNIIGLDTCGVSKPNKVIFDYLSRFYRVSADRGVSIGDRYDIDIAPALEFGMGGILVEKIDDIYALGNLF